jgi:hypothetical protein
LKRRSFVAHAAITAGSATAVTAVFGLGQKAHAAATVSVVVEWNRALLAAIARTRTQATVASRACALVHEAIYNAWVHYDLRAAFTVPGLVFKRPFWESNSTNKAIAICHAAHDVLVNLFPTEAAHFDALLTSRTPNPAVLGGGYAAVQTGCKAADLLLQWRRNDGSNQYGDLAPGAYADYTGYAPVNTPDTVVDPTRWQPLRVVDAVTGAAGVQKFLTPQWSRVRAFSMLSNSMFRPTMGHRAPTYAEMQELIDISAALTDRTKAYVDLWAANPGTVSPPGQWMLIAEQVSANDANTLDEDVKLFFGCAQALLDAGIAAWDAKRTWDSVRPITAIRYYFRNQIITAWGGSGRRTEQILGQLWQPYQRAASASPPFPEFVSGHSTFSASAAVVLAGIRASDGVYLTGTVKARTIGVEGFTTPVQDQTFSWTSLPQAADSAGLSRRYGGIHFEQGDLAGRQLGRSVGGQVLARCRALFEGRNVF